MNDIKEAFMVLIFVILTIILINICIYGSIIIYKLNEDKTCVLKLKPNG